MISNQSVKIIDLLGAKQIDSNTN